MPLSDLRNTRLFNDLAAQLRMHSLLISPISFLGVGGSGTLVKYRNLCGILTATHVMAEYLDTREIFSPVIATEDPTFFSERQSADQENFAS